MEWRHNEMSMRNHDKLRRHTTYTYLRNLIDLSSLAGYEYKLKIEYIERIVMTWTTRLSSFYERCHYDKNRFFWNDIQRENCFVWITWKSHACKDSKILSPNLIAFEVYIAFDWSNKKFLDAGLLLGTYSSFDTSIPFD